MIFFLSNHKDVSAVEALTGEKCELIPHPYINPEWTTVEVAHYCAGVINQASTCDRLIANGDYTLVALIVLARREAGKKTGFIAMQKLNEPTSEKDADGNIVHRNILKPISIRWV